MPGRDSKSLVGGVLVAVVLLLFLADIGTAAVSLTAIPLFQQVVVNTYSSSLHGVVQNDFIPDFDTAAWYCTAANCAG